MYNPQSFCNGKKGNNTVIQILLDFKIHRISSSPYSKIMGKKAVLFTFRKVENSAEISFSISPLMPPSPDEIFIWKFSADAKVIAYPKENYVGKKYWRINDLLTICSLRLILSLRTEIVSFISHRKKQWKICAPDTGSSQKIVKRDLFFLPGGK